MHSAEVFDPARFMPGSGLAYRTATYLRLGKARIYHHVHGWILACLLLWRDDAVDGRAAVVLALSLVMLLTMQWGAAAFDDIGGFRDGVDQRNYSGRPYLTVVKKPLVTGALTEREAVRFAYGASLAGLAACLLAALVAGGTAAALAAGLMVFAQVCSVQYSLGAKLSYQPLGQEFVVFTALLCTALVPYGLAAGSAGREILLVSALMGLWFLLVIAYGSWSDREGDAAGGRRTLAVVLPLHWFRFYLHLLAALSVLLLALLFTATRLDGRLAVCAVPVVVLQGVQLYYGAHRQELRRARFLGLLSLDAGLAGLAAAILLSR
ncbi:UbiA family prenyltransferase [Streptomyces sp. NPDC056773]|uniref:UbiA family prenyltransferase n=1 Tax=unclassified Streptomyces TaxID=2593676 RepID=UPI00368C6693